MKRIEKLIKPIIKLGMILAVMLGLATMTGCEKRQANVVSYNVSKEADNFNVVRRLTVINARTDTVILQMIGKMSIKDVSGGIDCLIEVNREKGIYQKHYIYTNEYTIVTVEDVSGVGVSRYDYEFELMPQTLIPVKVTANELTQDIEAWRKENGNEKQEEP